MELSDRKRQILKVVVEDYVRTAEPVGSKAIAAEMGGSVSSATIRNELSDLTEFAAAGRSAGSTLSCIRRSWLFTLLSLVIITSGTPTRPTS